MNTCQQPQPYDKMYLSTILYMNYIGLIQLSTACRWHPNFNWFVCVCARVSWSTTRTYLWCHAVSLTVVCWGSPPSPYLVRKLGNEWMRRTRMPQQQRIIRSHLLSFSFVLITLIIVCPFPSRLCMFTYYYSLCVRSHLLFLYVLLLFILCLWCNNRGYIGCIVVAPHYVILCW